MTVEKRTKTKAEKKTKTKRRSRPLRVERSGELIFMTCRTIEERYWLHPLLTCAASPPNRKAKRVVGALDRRMDNRYKSLAKDANKRMGKHCAPMTAERIKRMAKGLLGSALGRAQENTGVEFFAFVGMSNHFHLVLRTPNLNFAAFARDFKSIVAKSINRITGRRGPLWARRADSQGVLDDEAAAERATYTLNNPCKADLVADPETWPGLNLAFGLCDSDDIAFEYLDLEAWYQKGRPENIDDFFTTATVKLLPLPEMADMDRASYARIVRKWTAEAVQDAEREDDTKEAHGIARKRQVLGVEEVLRVAFDARPKNPKFRRRPYYFGCSELRRARYEEMSHTIAAYEEASARYRAGDLNARFPEGTYPPPLLRPALAA